MPAELFAEEGTLKGLVFALEEDSKQWMIGRDPDACQLVLEDPAASRVHAKLEKQEEGFFLENLSESSPVEINDTPLLEKTLLQEGDKIKIGGTFFHLYLEGTPAAQVEEEEIFPEEEEEEVPYGTIFKEEEKPEEIHIDLTTPARFILKVIAGPNSGAEFALEEKRSYLIGTDTSSCDIVFHDLSVSRQHARLEMGAQGEILIEDLESRNGVIIDRERIEKKTELLSNQVVILGTSAFLIVDREAPVKTIIAPSLELPKTREEEKEVAKEAEELAEEIVEEELVRVEKEGFPKKPSRPSLSAGALILTVILGCIAVLIGIGVVSLFQGGKEVVPAKRDYSQEIQTALKQFPGVKFNYNPKTNRLFLVGHVSTGVQKNELLYNLRGLTFIKGIDDNVVIDESIWQEMNILLSKQSAWKGVSMHSPRPGEFVLTGYLKTSKQGASLTDYMNLNFQFLDRLQNLVVVEDEVVEEVESELIQAGLGGVAPTFTNGELTLTGYISSTVSDQYQALLDKFRQIPGVRTIRSFVVILSPEKAVIDLNEKYPGRYLVTGYATHGDVNINVVVNGKIYMRGDTIDGMTITSIQPHTIYLEKEGLKFKIEYNR